jgi:hypothetical protein
MNRSRIATMTMLLSLAVSAYAANPFLNTQDDKPISAKFRGTEWSDDIGGQDIALAARVMTTRVAKIPWGAIFKLEFTDLKSRAEKQREIRPDYFIVTDDRIVLLNEEDNDAAAKKISALDKPPGFEPNDITALPATASNTRRESGKRQSN